MQMPLITAALRTPIGAYQGALTQIAAPRLAASVIREMLRQSGVPASDVGEVILGNVLGAGLGQNPARQAAAAAGIPFSSSALTIDMVCGSGLRAVCLAAQSIALGQHDVVIAGGMENMSAAPHLVTRSAPDGKPLSSLRHDGLRCAFEDRPMGRCADSLARAHRIGRGEQDQYAMESHRRAVESIDRGTFRREIVPVKPGGAGQPVLDADECPRRDSTLEKLSRLKPAFDTGGTVTAGNATAIADGAAAVMITSGDYARRRGIIPLAHILSWTIVGVEPGNTFGALAPVIQRLLAKNGIEVREVDVFEIGDSFAAEGIVGIRELGLPSERVNPRGGTLALGHPLGASGCRILVTLLHTLVGERKRLGIAAVCFGGGNAIAMLVENCSSA